MMQLITCSHCGKEGTFKIDLKATPEIKSCEACHHISTVEFNFYFCDLKCFKEWFVVNEKGVPCVQCRGTGFAFGFKENGTCKVCSGSKIIPLTGTENKERTNAIN